jgi:hypothetical protein
MSLSVQSIIELTKYLAPVHIMSKESNRYKAHMIRRNLMGVNNNILNGY